MIHVTEHPHYATDHRGHMTPIIDKEDMTGIVKIKQTNYRKTTDPLDGTKNHQDTEMTVQKTEPVLQAETITQHTDDRTPDHQTDRMTANINKILINNRRSLEMTTQIQRDKRTQVQYSLTSSAN